MHQANSRHRFLELLLLLSLTANFGQLGSAAEPSAQGPEAPRPESLRKPPSDLVTGLPPRQQHRGDSEPQAKPERQEKSPGLDTGLPARASSVEYGARHIPGNPSTSRTRNTAGPSLHLPSSNQTVGSKQKVATPSKVEPMYHSQPSQLPHPKPAAPVVDAFHSRVPVSGSIGGSGSAVKSNAALVGLNGTGIRHKP